MKVALGICIALILLQPLKAQDGWPGLPLFSNDGIVLDDQTTFLIVFSTAVISYALSEFVFKYENLNFYQVRAGYFGAEDKTSILLENVGIEKRVAPWFGIALELNIQQWISQDLIGTGNYSGIGMGINTYYRWYLFGKKKISPYLEYGAGLFYGFKEFPQNGSNFTFNLTTSLGIEYTMKKQNKIRFSYGHIHQSNNNLYDSNPGIDGNGLNLTYLWFLKKSKW